MKTDDHSIGCNHLLIGRMRLGDRAEMRTALRQPDFFDGMTTVETGLPGATIDIKMMLRFAGCAIRFAIPVDTGAFVVDTRLQRSPNRSVQPDRLGAGQRIGTAQRVNSGAVQRLISVDIAHPGDKSL